MEIAKVNYTLINVTLLFNNINRDLIRRDILRHAFGDIVLAEFPGVMLINLSEDQSIQIVIDDKRVTLNCAMKPGDVINPRVKFLATAMSSLIEAMQDNKPIAYGLNYQMECNINCEVDLNKQLLEVCFGGGHLLAAVVEEEITSVKPRFGFVKDGVGINISLEPSEQAQILHYHCNVHFDSNEPDGIEEKFLTYSDYCTEILEKLLRRG